MISGILFLFLGYSLDCNALFVQTKRFSAVPSTILYSAPHRAVIKPLFDDSEGSGITLTRYMLETSNANKDLRELESLTMALQTACKTIASVIDRASLTGMIGLQSGGGSINIQGEEQKKLDGIIDYRVFNNYILMPHIYNLLVLSNEILKKTLRFTGKVGVLASEEEDTPVAVTHQDKYREVGLRTTQFENDV